MKRSFKNITKIKQITCSKDILNKFKVTFSLEKGGGGFGLNRISISKKNTGKKKIRYAIDANNTHSWGFFLPLHYLFNSNYLYNIMFLLIK